MKTEAYTATYKVEEPLKTFRGTLHGEGQAFDDPSALLQKDTSGRPVNVALDLLCTTDGDPYKYRITTRYEIPCTISGTITIDDETITLNECPGQRDHSWGSRDWWLMDWVWSALHLQDGTHTYGFDLLVPSRPRMYIGYSQGAGKDIKELSKHVSEEAFAENRLATATKLTMQPDEMVVDMEMMGHGPLRLEADDGRVGILRRLGEK